MKVVTLVDVKPLDLDHQQNADAILRSALTYLAKHCEGLKMVTIPCVFGIGGTEPHRILTSSAFCLGYFVADFTSSRYSFELVSYNETMRRTWFKYF